MSPSTVTESTTFLDYLWSVVSGHRPLWSTYWLWCVLPKFVFMSGDALLANLHSLQTSYISIGLLCLLWFFMIVGGFGVWWNRYASHWLLKNLACISVLLIWVGLMAKTAEVFR